MTYKQIITQFIQYKQAVEDRDGLHLNVFAYYLNGSSSKLLIYEQFIIQQYIISLLHNAEYVNRSKHNNSI